jgi:hypothetical protein
VTSADSNFFQDCFEIFFVFPVCELVRLLLVVSLRRNRRDYAGRDGLKELNSATSSGDFDCFDLVAFILRYNDGDLSIRLGEGFWGGAQHNSAIIHANRIRREDRGRLETTEVDAAAKSSLDLAIGCLQGKIEVTFYKLAVAPLVHHVNWHVRVVLQATRDNCILRTSRCAHEKR